MTGNPEGPAPGRTPKWIGPAILAIVALGFLAGLLWKRPEPPPASGLPKEISVAQAAVLRDQGSLLLDVRQPEEWAESHVPGSTLIPLGELEARVGEVPRDRRVIVVCRSGNRSQRGRDILIQAGFGHVTSMGGGLNAWAAEGHPTVSGP